MPVSCRLSSGEVTPGVGKEAQKPGVRGSSAKVKEELRLASELEKAKTTAPKGTLTVARPGPATRQLNFTEEQANLLLDYFTTVIRRVQKKDPTPSELDKVGGFIDRLQVVKPAVRFERAKTQVEDYAKGLNALARGAKVPETQAKARVRDILNKMLEGELTPEEEDELAKLEGRLESDIDANLPISMMEPQYEPPTVMLVGDAGPGNLLFGKPLRPPAIWPRDFGRYWEVEIANQNKANFEKRGFKVHVEEL